MLSRFDDLVITVLCQCLFYCNKQDNESYSLTEYGMADQYMLGPYDVDCMDNNAIVKLQYDMMQWWHKGYRLDHHTWQKFPGVPF